MLQKNRLQPPMPPRLPPMAVGAGAPHRATPFVSPEDFDATGILAGVDPCESLYWWLADLYGPDADHGAEHPRSIAAVPQATRRASRRSTAAA